MNADMIYLWANRYHVENHLNKIKLKSISFISNKKLFDRTLPCILSTF